MKSNLKAIVNFLFEVGILAQTPRSGFHFLGSGKQSVAEHINRVVYAGFVLAHMEGDVDTAKVLEMCLFHDIAEARIGDLNYVHQKYLAKNEEQAIKDLTKSLPFGKRILSNIQEYEVRETKESLVAKDADHIEWILSLKEQVDTGSHRAEIWLEQAIKRLKTKSGRQLAQEILTTNADEWWFTEENDEWWINRKRSTVINQEIAD